MNIVVYLVHGTFKPEAPWVQDDSAVTCSIRKILGENVSIRKFTWDGLNSFSSRAKAATALKEELDNLAASGEFDRICLVAHSHGGNIAFDAVSNMKYSGRVTAMVSLGTPYLRVVRKAWAPPRLFALALSFWLGVFLVIVTGSIIVFPLGLCTFWLFAERFVRANKDSQNLSSLKPSLGGTGILPILCIRHGGDEASAWLFLLSITRASEAILSAAGKKLIGNFWRILVEAFVLGFTISALFLFSIDFGIVAIFLGICMLIVFLLPILSVIGALLTSHRYGLGGRPNLKSFFIHPYVSTKPWTGEIHEAKFSGILGIYRASSIWPIRIVTPHSLGYCDPKAITKVASWLKIMCQ